MKMQQYAQSISALIRSVGGAAPVPSEWFEANRSPWDWRKENHYLSKPAFCNICFWRGKSFENPGHSEMGDCPCCRSIARDRFLFLSFVSCSTECLGARVLETSPRLENAYRTAMKRWFQYSASDFDEHGFKADIRVDLENIELEDNSLEVILTSHVLEHVPNTERALQELYRVLAPGGQLFIQVPILQGMTAPPSKPEFHSLDRVPVFWRFGFDLSDQLRSCRFEIKVLCTSEFYHHVAASTRTWPTEVSAEFDVSSMLGAARIEDLHSISDQDTSSLLALNPGYMHITWQCRKP